MDSTTATSMNEKNIQAKADGLTTDHWPRDIWFKHFVEACSQRLKPEKCSKALAKLYIKKCCERIYHSLFQEIVNKLQSNLVSSWLLLDIGNLDLIIAAF